MTQTKQTLRKATAKLAETELDGEIVLMNIDTGSFHALKDTGLAIWKLIDGHRDLPAICDQAMALYDIDADTCTAEVGQFIDQMVEAGFVERG